MTKNVKLNVYFPIINHKDKVVNIGIDTTTINTNYVYTIEDLYRCKKDSIYLYIFNFDNISYITIKDTQIEIMNGISVLPLADFIENDTVELNFDKIFKGKVAVIAQINEAFAYYLED